MKLGLRRRALRHRYGRSLGPQAITIGRPDGKYDVVIVDGRGNALGVLARGVPYGLARSIIRRRHG